MSALRVCVGCCTRKELRAAKRDEAARYYFCDKCRPRVDFSIRFRAVANRYPRQVAAAYEGDLARAMEDSDEEVAARVAAWEAEQGLVPRDWYAIGAAERVGDDDAR